MWEKFIKDSDWKSLKRISWSLCFFLCVNHLVFSGNESWSSEFDRKIKKFDQEYFLLNNKTYFLLNDSSLMKFIYHVSSITWLDVCKKKRIFLFNYLRWRGTIFIKKKKTKKYNVWCNFKKTRASIKNQIGPILPCYLYFLSTN